MIDLCNIGQDMYTKCTNLVLGGDGLALSEAIRSVHVLKRIEDGALGAILVSDLF